MQDFKAMGVRFFIDIMIGPGGRGRVSWVNFCWVSAAGLSEPLPHYSLFCRGIIDPVLVTFGKK